MSRTVSGRLGRPNGQSSPARQFHERYAPAALFVLVAVVMGVGYVAVGVGVESAPPLALASHRFYLTAIVLVCFAAATGRDWRPRAADDWAAVGVTGSLTFAGAVGLLFVGQRHTTAAVAATLMSLGPVLTALSARAIPPGERLSHLGTAGVLVGLVGTLAIARPSTGGLLGTDAVGAGLVICAAASGGIGSVLFARIRSRSPLATLTGWGSLVGGVVLHAASVALGESAAGVAWTPTLFAVLLYLSVVVGGVGYVALTHLIRTVGPTRSSLTAYASPAVATVVGWAVLGEPPTTAVALGLAAIATGFLLLVAGRRSTDGTGAVEQPGSAGD